MGGESGLPVMTKHIPLVDLNVQHDVLRPALDSAVRRVLDSSRFILGPEVANFEEEFAAYVGTSGCVAVASGTAALHLALLAVGVGPEDEVIAPTFTFAATIEAIVYCGATPVLVDLDPSTFNLDVREVEARVSERTAAIVAVHLYGHPADMRSLRAVAERTGIRLIEDAAQAHGASYEGVRCGALGDLACFSFFPAKNLGAAGDAGGVTGTDPELLDRVRLLRNHGRTSKYEHAEIGYAERMDELQAALLRTKLPYLDGWIDERRALAARYQERLAETQVVPPAEGFGAQHAYHLFVIRSVARDRLRDALDAAGVESGIHYPIPFHKQEAFVQVHPEDLELPESERAAGEVLSLPLYPGMDLEDVDYVCDVIGASVSGQ